MSTKITALKKGIARFAECCAPQKPHVYLDPDYPILRINHPFAVRYDYDACPAVNSFLHDPEYQNKIIIGAFGTGKTAAIMQYILWRAATMPVCDDGVRRYKCALIRNTSGELESTVLQTWLDWSTYLPSPIGRENNKIKQNPNYFYQFYDKDGLIEVHLFFLALDREDSGKKLGSLEVTDGYIGEGQYVSISHFKKLGARIGRFPKKIMFNDLWEKFRIENKIPSFLDDTKEHDKAYSNWFPYQKKIFSDTNPPPTRHWIASLENKSEEFELADEKVKIKPFKVYHQPPNIIKNVVGKWEKNLNADNVKYQSPSYWLEMLENGEDYAKVYAQGYYGLAKEGQVVFPQFNQDIHVVSGLEAVEECPLLISWDISLNALAPGAMITQLTPKGRTLMLKEFCADRASNRELAGDVVLPYINRHYKGFELIPMVRDPASEAGKGVKDLLLQSGSVLKEIFGVDSYPAKTTKVKERCEAVKWFLTKLVDGGKPAFAVSKEGCPILIEAFLAKYIYLLKRIVGEEEYREEPRKTHPHGEAMDCCQYACCEFGGSGIRHISKKPYNINYKQILANNTVL